MKNAFLSILSSFPDPDIVSGDGVYSRHLIRRQHQPSSSGGGRYSFRITADDNEGRAFVATNAENNSGGNSRQCCGSAVSLNPEQTEKTGTFRRSVKGPTVNLAAASEDDQGKDRIPPSRIGDLKVTVLPGSNNLLATWTAPGGDFDRGQVAAYRFVFSEDIGQLLRPSSVRPPKILLGFDRLEEAGTQSSFDFEFPHYDRDFYVAAYAFDAAGNRGKISNLVHVRVDSPASMDRNANKNKSTSSSPIFSLSGGLSSDLDWVMIGVIAGIVTVMFVLSVVAVGYYFVVASRKNKKRSSSSGKAGSTSSMVDNGGGSSGGGPADETDSSSFDSDIKNIMSNPLGPALNGSAIGVHHHHHHQISRQLQHLHGSSVDSGMSSSDSPAAPSEAVNAASAALPQSSSANVTPVYWSASQLLSKLDHNSPYVTAVSSDYTSYPHHHHNLHHHHQVPVGPHSLQPGSLLVASGYNAASAASTSDWQIPEEYTITVGNLVTSSSSSSKDNNKVPPPVMPKPRNITQV